MRAQALACLMLTLAAPAMAEDRYGAQASARPEAAPAAPGPRLSWPGKVNPAAQDTVPSVSAAPARLADGVLRRTSAYDAPPAAPVPVAIAKAEPAPAENAPWRRLTGVAAPMPTATPAMMEEAQVPRPTLPVAAAAPIAAAQPRSAAPTEHASAASGEQAKFYSLHREYGETPDAIPAPQKSQIFLAGGPLTSGVGGDEDIDRAEGDGTGKTAALNKARLAADWVSSSAK